MSDSPRTTVEWFWGSLVPNGGSRTFQQKSILLTHSTFRPQIVHIRPRYPQDSGERNLRGPPSGRLPGLLIAWVQPLESREKTYTIFGLTPWVRSTTPSTFQASTNGTRRDKGREWNNPNKKCQPSYLSVTVEPRPTILVRPLNSDQDAICPDLCYFEPCSYA